MVLTPLHSQNFLDIEDGVITNNRRLVTKSMWFNGTELSNKAQRAIRNEQITIVANNTGFVHCFYPDATIDKNIYQKFTEKLRDFLCSPLDITAMASFLRGNLDYQQYFQFCKDCHGSARFIKAETLFHYENQSRFRIADATHEKLLAEAGEEDFSSTPYPGRIRCDQFKELVKAKMPDIKTEAGRKILADFFAEYIPDSAKLVQSIFDFLNIAPKLPAVEKKYTAFEPLKISTDMSREEIVKYLTGIRDKNITADLAFYAFRDMASCDWQPFIKAALERSPVSIDATKDMTIAQVFDWLAAMPNVSIYDNSRLDSTGSPRLAQPDEVANYKTGDGIEKAFTLANIIHSRDTKKEITIKIDNDKVVVEAGTRFEFTSAKKFQKNIIIRGE
jgi:thiol-disulfide isomerase/thioredoxin